MRLLVWLTLCLTAWGGELPAQVRKKIPEPKIERQSSIDGDGLRQWKKLEAKACPGCRGGKNTPCINCKTAKPATCAECNDTQTAACRICAGSGQVFDPLVELICAYCDGRAWYNCGLCKGRGAYPVQGGGKKKQKCGGCKKRGAVPCAACKGKRHLAVVKVGRKGPGMATVKQLTKARAVLDQALTRLKSFRPSSRESKSMKDFGKIVDKAAKVLPALKGGKAALKASLKAISKGSGYVGYTDWVVHEFQVFQDKTIYLLLHQIKLLDLCIARAEHNEKLLAAAKNAKKHNG